jgi:sugar/nucleoside kinase (ribokinase family)
MKRNGILAGGNWIVDKLKRIDVYPQQDALANILDESIGNGGSPFNILTDLSRMGASFPLEGVGLVGADSEGRWIEEQCDAHGIGRAQLRVHAEAHTSYTDVMTVASTGRRTFFHQRGANAFLDGDAFDFSQTGAKIFHLGYLLLLDRLDLPDAEFGTAAARVLNRARAAGLKTSIDVVSEDSHRFSGVVLPALRQVDYCILNEFELERTSGIATRPDGKIDLRAVETASRKLLEAGVNEWVVVHFPEGAAALGRCAESLCIQGSVVVPQERIVSTVGAGDAFAAGLLHGLHDETGIERALQYGVCAAAACLGGTGASNGIPSLAECLKIGEEAGFKALSH